MSRPISAITPMRVPATPVDSPEGATLSSSEMPASGSVFRVLFLCTGNTCRSPMAAAALRLGLGADHHRVEIRSAGIAAHEGQPVAALAERVSASHGAVIGDHRARRLSRGMLSESDLILV
ncbi:MAG: hypothetical protein ACRDL7_05515, partial [Gaiellaceae bacterium]